VSDVRDATSLEPVEMPKGQFLPPEARRNAKDVKSCHQKALKILPPNCHASTLAPTALSDPALVVHQGLALTGDTGVLIHIQAKIKVVEVDASIEA
jgi:hypothetical protein